MLKKKAADLPIRRTPLSGGWGTGKNLTGDLVQVDESCHGFNCLSVEIKFQEGWSFDSIMSGGDAKLRGWWKQCVNAASFGYKVPVLVFRKSLNPWYVMANNRFLDMAIAKGKRRKVILTVNPLNASIMLLSDFVSIASSKLCAQIIRFDD
jgi:hypothetical protein